MNLTLLLMLSMLVLIAAMVGLAEVGRRLGMRRLAAKADGAVQGLGVVEGALFGLMGLVLALTFAHALSRFDVRRDMVVDEVNAIGTAYLRLDALPADSRAALQDSFRRYVDSRLRVYRVLPDMEAAYAELQVNKVLQDEIWRRALAALQGAQPATMLVLPALNQMFDTATVRTVAARIHPAPIVYILLCGLALICSLVAGYGMANAGSHDWFRTLGFAMVTGLMIYVVIDMEYPRVGLINIDAVDQAMEELRESMN